MKKAKRDRKSVGRKVATIVILGCVLVGMAWFGIYLWGMASWAGWLADRAYSVTMGMQSYKEVGVSDDGRWFLIPEARVKIPYFVPEHEGKSEDRPLRYRYGVLGSSLPKDDPGRGFELTFTYDFIDSSYIKDWPDSCVDPFIFFYNLEDWRENLWHEYDPMNEITLADGRVLGLAKKNTELCARYYDDALGKVLIDRLGKVESY